MAKKKEEKIELPARYIQVSTNPSGAKKNGFAWSELIKKKKTYNTFCFGVGYDTYRAALKSAKAHTKRLSYKLDIYHRGKLVG